MPQAIAEAAPAAAVKDPPPLPTAEQLVALLRQRVAAAVEDLGSDDPVRALAAELELSCVCNPALFPTADGRWHQVRGARR